MEIRYGYGYDLLDKLGLADEAVVVVVGHAEEILPVVLVLVWRAPDGYEVRTGLQLARNDPLTAA